MFQKNNRRNLAILSGLATAGGGIATTGGMLGSKKEKLIKKINKLQKSHEDRISNKYDKLMDIVDNKSEEVLKEVRKKRVKTGNPIVDIFNEFEDTNKVLNAKYKIKDDILDKELNDLGKVRNAANRLKKRVSKKMNKRLAIASGVTIYKGGKLISNSINEITGLERTYHNTERKNIDNILKEGIKSKYAADPENLTNSALVDIDMDKKKDLVYLAKKKADADDIGRARREQSAEVITDPVTGRRRLNYAKKDTGKTLHVNIPYEDLKKMNLVENPELRGAKNKKEFRKIYKKLIELGDGEELSEADKISSDDHYKFLKNDTYTIKGDIDPKYIKESKKYNKYKLRDFGKYVKNNPKRFIKGVGKASLGGGLISLGSIGLVKFGKKLIKNNKKEEKK